MFGKDVDINTYYNDNETLLIELLTVADDIDERCMSIRTVGLSEIPLHNPDGTVPALQEKKFSGEIFRHQRQPSLGRSLIFK